MKAATAKRSLTLNGSRNPTTHFSVETPAPSSDLRCPRTSVLPIPPRPSAAIAPSDQPRVQNPRSDAPSYGADLALTNPLSGRRIPAGIGEGHVISAGIDRRIPGLIAAAIASLVGGPPFAVDVQIVLGICRLRGDQAQECQKHNFLHSSFPLGFLWHRRETPDPHTTSGAMLAKPTLTG